MPPARAPPTKTHTQYGVWAGVLVVVAEVGFATLLLKSMLDIEGMDRYAKKFRREEQIHLSSLSGDELGPLPFKPVQPVLQAEGATLDSLLAQANELLPAFETEVMRPMSTLRDGTVLATKGPGIKGAKRAREKIRNDYDNDPRQLKDVVRCSVICVTMAQLCESIEKLRSLTTDVQIVQAGIEASASEAFSPESASPQIKNRFRGGAAPGGYKDVNMNVVFRGLVCEVQVSGATRALSQWRKYTRSRALLSRRFVAHAGARRSLLPPQRGRSLMLRGLS